MVQTRRQTPTTFAVTLLTDRQAINLRDMDNGGGWWG